jgi:serine/threonine-protein kinase
VLDLETGAQKILVRGGSHARYVSSGHLVYGVSGTLRAVAFDLARLEVVGNSVPVVPELMTSITGAANFDVANDGTLVYVPGGVVGGVLAGRTLVWVDRQGREEALKAPRRAYTIPRISPDGTRIAVEIRDQMQDIWVWDIGRATLTRVTFNPTFDNSPVWTPDGRRLLFAESTEPDRSGSLVWQSADGTGAVERLADKSREPISIPQAISPDGARVVVLVRGGAPFGAGLAASDLASMLLAKERRVEPLMQTPYRELNADISPDGRWLAYESDESGQREVYVRPFPNVSGGRWQVSPGGGTRPVFGRNGQELFYLATSGTVGADATLMSVRIQPGSTWVTGNPAKLFTGRYFYGPGVGLDGRTYDVSPDGRRFLMIKDSDTADQQAAAPPNLVVVQHWAEELKRLVPTK